MIAGILAQFRQCRHPLIAVTVALVVLQALVAGLATAQSAARLAAGPFDAGAICHGAGGAGAETDTPGPGVAGELCCVFCAATAPALLTVTPPVVGYVGYAAAGRPTSPAPDLELIARYAVRAGPSQAPPSLA